MDWENYLEKNSNQKLEKTVNIKVKLPHVNKKPLAGNIAGRIPETTRRKFPTPITSWTSFLIIIIILKQWAMEYEQRKRIWPEKKDKASD